ncbi:hypothetical protein Nepgr_029414 [Nepenthes gracilis]|uniref:Glutamine amidotransferase type-2 domain-containing protein n=1 Tax=Nepenthes gracilis TaxID=150966 RepID=A0AAD3Y5I6_NEPGR|nr:hypothetical protein Nepgr_029414 [Nepenthes gracilis]
MCGIALVVSGIRIDLTSISCEEFSPTDKVEQCVFTTDDMNAALRRRGPDSLGSRGVFLELKTQASVNDRDLLSSNVGDEEKDDQKFCIKFCSEVHDCRLSANGENGFPIRKSYAEMLFTSAVLQLRGVIPVMQPLADASGNILIYNGEIYGGLQISSDSNDAEILMQTLGNCCCCYSHRDMSTCDGKPIPELLSSLKGPWAIIYWQNTSRTLWFGRDAFGRRSLLVHWPTSEDSRLLLSSISPKPSFDSEDERRLSSLNYWEEFPCGVYSMSIYASKVDACLVGDVQKHEWTNSMLKELIGWERKFVEPKNEEFHSSNFLIPAGQYDMLLDFAAGFVQSSVLTPAHMVLAALRQSVARRTTEFTIFQAVVDAYRQGEPVPVAVLFSGGLDSMILAALLHQCLDPRYAIDLLNVSFAGQSAPDRITARVGVKVLKRVAPLRSWRLVEIDANLSNLIAEMKHVRSLISPAKTYMDLNIGIALWLAAGGDGWLYEATNSNGDEVYHSIRYKSEARILLVGSGADEQCAGYGRHRTKYRSSSWLGLHEEMKLDMQRIWKRNLGRDDRCIADNGKEARFPFLDEDVIRVLLDFPLWEIANLDQPSGTGDKKILREVARLLGLHEAATLPKRAIQFGSRIAQESNRKNFGSNRAANQASAGSVDINKS